MQGLFRIFKFFSSGDAVPPKQKNLKGRFGVVRF